MQQPNEIWTPKETATYLRVQLSTIYKMVHERRIPFIKKFARLRFRKTAIDRWLESKHGPR
jgi:excisionase family DNA binding protein